MPSFALFPNVGVVDLAVQGGALRDEMLRWLYVSGLLRFVLVIGIVACVTLLVRSRMVSRPDLRAGGTIPANGGTPLPTRRLARTSPEHSRPRCTS
jgi:hypothetical protein